MTLTIAAALAAARRAGVDRLDAMLLLGHRLGRDRSWLIAHDDSVLDADAAADYEEQIRRRAGGEPLAYLVGEKEFHGLRLEVDARVLVPRPDTEVLVDWALELLSEGATAAAPRVVDLGTGSGAIALAIKKRAPEACVVATDVSAGSLSVARRNALQLGLAVEFVEGRWWQPLAGREFDLALSNPPYIRLGDPHLVALAHEPQGALEAGPSGLDDLRAIIAGASPRLSAGAWLLLEHGHDQGPDVQALLERYGFDRVATRADLAGHPRCTGGRRPSQ
ncbi:MAG: peptide chain release factor N(5)-glutamine methyltransferase [Piscinibacter sp.]|nr:peptide chain release factor N(5)-glutamine methyltransferase [Piscinibacter sp.]